MRWSTAGRWCYLAPCLMLAVLAACRSRPRDCEVRAYHRHAHPLQEGAAPDLTRLGAALPPQVDLQRKPKLLAFARDDRVTISWIGFGHVYTASELVYAPAERVARAVGDGGELYPLLRMRDGERDLVRIGFRSRLCSDRESIEHGTHCREYQTTEDLIIAEALCR